MACDPPNGECCTSTGEPGCLRGELLPVCICKRCWGRDEAEGAAVLGPAVVGVMGREGPGAGGSLKGDEDELMAFALHVVRGSSRGTRNEAK